MGSRFELRAQRWHKQCRPRKFVLLLLAFFLLFRSVTSAEVNGIRRVLVFNDFDPMASPGVALLDQAIFAAVSQSRYQIEWYDDTLGANLFPDEASQHNIREGYVRKYQDRKPNLIIAVGPASLQFMIESHERVFPGVPIIFCGSSEEMIESLKPDSDFTGVWGTVQPEETFKAALHLQPTTKHVVVVGGVGAYDRYLEKIVKGSLRNYESKFEFTYLTDQDMPTLLGRLSRLPSDTIVLYTSIFQDAAGARFIDANQSAPMVVGATNVPVFVLFDVNFGTGAVGGDLVSFASDGKIAGQMAVSILNGRKPGDIPVVKNANVMTFDWRALRRWRFKESDLPPGSGVFYRQPKVWEAYKDYMIPGVALIFAETLLIFTLLWQRKRRRDSELHLRESEERFRLVANTAPVMIWMSGPDRLYNYFNQPWLEFTGRALEAELGNGWSEGVHPEDVKDCRDTYTRAFDLREPFKMQYRLRRQDGEYRWLFDTGVPRVNSDGSFAGYIGSCIDVTVRRLAEQAMADIRRKLIEAQEQERLRIGRELHDDVTQRLALLAVELAQLQHDPSEVDSRLERLRKETSEISNDVEALSHELHSSKLQYLGVVAGIKSWCREFGERQNMEIDFRSDVATALPFEIGICLFRVLQEALHNAHKHSGVKRVEVRLMEESNQVHLIVSDSGKGFDFESAKQGRGLGLTSMQERVRLVNGTIAIESKPIGGTTIEVRVPLQSLQASQRASQSAG
jgi:PAS domain S-box-containing protein